MSKLREAIVLLVLSLALGACAAPAIPLHDPASDASPPASIVLPEPLEVVSVNGLAIEGTRGMLGKGETILEVSPGRYEVLAFYRELWERGDQHEVLRSDPAMFVVEAAAGRRYLLDYSRPATMDEARALAGNFSGWVEDVASGARTPSAPSGLQFRRGLVAAATFDDTLVPVAPVSGTRQTVAPLTGAEPSTKHGLAVAVAPTQQAAPAVTAPVTEPLRDLPQSQESQGEEDWLALMKSWWGEASAEERREFLRWVGERR